MTQRTLQQGDDYQRVAAAISFLQNNVHEQPSLDEVASHIGLSPYHFQRMFRRWAGVSPKRFLEYLTVNHAKNLLDDSKSVLDTALDLGLSSPARLHDQFISIEAITPGQYKKRGKGMEIRYGLHPGPFGEMLLAQTEKGICSLAFVDARTRESELNQLKEAWSGASLIEDRDATSSLARSLFENKGKLKKEIHLSVRGTNFQINVWKALLKIPSATVTSYQALSDLIGKPAAVRATANAVASNPVAFLIPCHRVLRSTGALSGYRWGPDRKQLLLAWEQARYGDLQ